MALVDSWLVDLAFTWLYLCCMSICVINIYPSCEHILGGHLDVLSLSVRATGAEIPCMNVSHRRPLNTSSGAQTQFITAHDPISSAYCRMSPGVMSQAGALDEVDCLIPGVSVAGQP